MKNKIEDVFFYLLLTFVCVLIFFYLNPMNYWYEGNIENLYFIYNSVLSSLKITPLVIDYPGTPSFIINGSMYNIFLGNFSSINEINNTYQIDDYLDKALKINKYIQLIYLNIYLIFTFKILNEISLNKYLNLILILVTIFSPPIIENFQLARIENDALCFMSISIFFYIRFIKTDGQHNFFLFVFFFLLMLFTKVLYIFNCYLLIIFIFFFKKKKILKNLDKYYLIFTILIINIVLFGLLFGIQFYIDKLSLISIIFSIFTYGVTASFLIYLWFILGHKISKIIFSSLISCTLLILVIYLTNSNFSHIYYVIFPFDLLKQHLRGAYSIDANILEQIILIINKIYLNFTEFKIYLYEIVFLIYFLICFTISKKNQLINYFLIFLFFLFKIIFNIKYYLYYDSITILILIFVYANISNFKSNLKYIFISCILIICLNSTYKIFLYKELQWNSEKNSTRIIKNFCKYSLISENKFNQLDIDDPEHYALYHTKNLMTYKNIKSICSTVY